MQHSGTLATGLSLGRTTWAKGFANADESRPLDATKLKPFVDPLPILPVVHGGPQRPDPEDSSRRIGYYHVTMQEVTAQLHRDLSFSKLWGFNGSFPGPVLEARVGKPLMVEWANKLPKRHLLPAETALNGPECCSVIHLQGGRTPSGSDGYPDDWVASGKSLAYYYPNNQDAALLTYHDHTRGMSHLNVYAGLQGMYLLRDESEASLNLPKGKYEIPLMLCERSLFADGRLRYAAPASHEEHGSVILANGKITPYLDVESHRYRLRIANGSNAQPFRLRMGEGHAMYVIGGDQGLLSAPVKVSEILLWPGERTDVVVDFMEASGRNLVLASDNTPIMQFRVRSSDSTDESALPPSLMPVRRLRERDASRVRRMTLELPAGTSQAALRSAGTDTVITEKPVLGSTEIWEIVNPTEEVHPVHLHMVRFQILDRRGFDVAHYRETKEVRSSVPPNLVAKEESGWKDTVRCEKGQVTRIIVPFEPYAGRYLWHTRIFEDEDRGLIRPFEIVNT